MTHTVAIDMKECFEDIEVYTVAVDGGSDIGSTTTPGKRTIPLNLLLLWGEGSFSSPTDCLNYHFREYGRELGITNIVSYVNSAQGFRASLSGATSSPVPGATPDVTRWKKNGKYIDIHGTKNVGLIISYGRQ